MAEQLTDSAIAQAVRARWPGAYEDWSDAELAAAVRKDRPDLIAELQPQLVSFKEGYRPDTPPDVGNLTRSAIPQSVLDRVTSAIQGSSENVPIAKARGFAAGAAQGLADAATSPLSLMLSASVPELPGVVRGIGEAAPRVDVRSAARSLAPIVRGISDVKATKPFGG